MNKQMTLEEFVGRGLKAQKAIDKIIDRPLSHTNDPITSYKAADKMIKSGKLSKQEQVVWFEINRGINNMKTCLELRHQNFTAKELSAWSGLNYFVIQRRLSGLFHKGKIERTGEKRDGCCVWKIIAGSD